MQIISGIYPNDLRQIGEKIAQTIDFPQSKEARRTCVMQGINPELDALKRNYDGLEHFLNEVAAQLMTRIPEWARPHVQNCIFYPQIGFLTVVNINPETGRGEYNGEGSDDDGWDSMFVADGQVYCKNQCMRELDVQYGDLYGMIVGQSSPVYPHSVFPGLTQSADKEIEIVHELGVQILEHEEALITASELCGELDSLLALARGADKYRLKAPRMADTNEIHIKEGRHILQELVVPSFIPNDTNLLGGTGTQPDHSSIVSADMLNEAPSIMVMTGPNHSGKSVYLKQVALIVYLAHIGSYVPAEQACIGLTDRLLTRIATRESVSRNESAFAIDLKQAAFSINFATRRSLILVDEFGKGTNTMDGAGLVTALLDHFLHLEENAPKVLVATHFHEIFEQNFLPDSPRLSFGHMEVHVDAEAENMEDQVTYLFRLTPGRSASSFGSRCAAMNGVDAAVVQRADALTLLLARGEDLRAACARLSDRENQMLEEAESVARDFVEMDLDGLNSPEEGRGSTRSLREHLFELLDGSASAASSSWE